MMLLITAPFDAAQAEAKAAELLALGDLPERLAEMLGTPRDLEAVREGVQVVSFKRVLVEVDRLRKFIELEDQIEKLETDKSLLRFLGSGFKEKQLARLGEEKKKFGSLLEGPAWFYRQPRVRLLSSIRDFALDNSQQGEPSWTEVSERQLVFPIVDIFEQADRDGAQILVEELEKPLKEISPRFLLENFEGHRSITFDLETGIALYHAPTNAHREG
jgi:hypothetical protein